MLNYTYILNALYENLKINNIDQNKILTSFFVVFFDVSFFVLRLFLTLNISLQELLLLKESVVNLWTRKGIWANEANRPRRCVGGMWWEGCLDLRARDGWCWGGRQSKKLVFIISEMYGRLGTCGPVAAVSWGTVSDRLRGLKTNLLRSSQGGYYCYMA